LGATGVIAVRKYVGEIDPRTEAPKSTLALEYTFGRRNNQHLARVTFLLKLSKLLQPCFSKLKQEMNFLIFPSEN